MRKRGGRLRKSGEGKDTKGSEDAGKGGQKGGIMVRGGWRKD